MSAESGSRNLLALLISALLASVLSAANAEEPDAASRPTAWVDSERMARSEQEAESWLSHGRDYAERRFSPLAQITRQNVAGLGLAWSYRTGTHRGMEATPLVADGVLYATGSWSVVYALDAASGRQLWRYDPKVPRETGRKACCDVVNRGVALWRGRVYLGTLDGRLVALNAETGALVWQVQTVDPKRDYTITGAPRVVKGRVIIGNGGAEYGVRGYFSAYDAATGERLWRFYTVPGDPAKPFEHPELAMAARTWSPNSRWETGLGGTVWDSMAYDPELDLLYVGVGNSSPYNRAVRSPGGGDNLFLSSILAVKPETGKLVWHYQTTPGESWDYTATQHMILAELKVAGRERKVLMQAPKNGFFYLLDRETGELLSAEKLVPMNWASHVDLETGRPVETGRANWATSEAVVMPGVQGGHNWHPMSFSPRTGLVYIPTLYNVWPFIPERDFRQTPGTFNTGEDFPELENIAKYEIPLCEPSHLTAWDPVAGKQVWRVVHPHPVNGGVLSTAGDLVFQGNGSGVFHAYDAHDGEKLWESNVEVGVMAAPISYAIDGEQYVAVVAGIGGSPAINYLDLENTNDGMILAYKLGADAKLPKPGKHPPGVVQAEPIQAAPETLEQGRRSYSRQCARCHGFDARSTRFLPDLRMASKAVHDNWDAIVLLGAFQHKGMAGFADLISPEESRAIHAFVVGRALAEATFLEIVHDWARKNLCVPHTWLAD